MPDLKNLLLDTQALDRLLPLNMHVGSDGVITHFGPTLAKMLKVDPDKNVLFFELFKFRRPRNITNLREFNDLIGEKLVLSSVTQPNMRFPGLLEKIDGEDSFLFNLSLGAGVLRAIREEALLAKDFAPTDTTVDLMYMVEVQAAVLAASRNLNNRLHGAKMLAEEQAFTDSLTGLNNRRALRRFIRRQLEQSPRRPFAVVLIDLDKFKAVNDTLGHAAGDFVLKETAQKLLDNTRPSDMVARVGGDEFVLVLPEFSDTEALRKFTQRLVDELGQPISYGGETCKVGASMGARVTRDGQLTDVDLLLKESDEALYSSKARGRGRVTLVDQTG